MESNKLFVIDEQGQEIEMEILFTFENEARAHKYVLYFDPTDDSGEVFASIYDDEGNLFPIEEETEWAIVEEVFGTFLSDSDEEEDEEEEPVN